VLSLANAVERVNINCWLAKSAASAAAWLLAIADKNARLDHPPLEHWCFSERRTLICFRGQPARYETLLPTIYRCDPQTRRRHAIAREWLQVVLQLWCDNRFRFVNDRGWRNYRLDTTEVNTIAQHYQIGTKLIDWTWDPAIAVCFAADGTCDESVETPSSRVLLRTVPRESKEQVLLPPAFATRIWHQRGLFQEHDDPASNDRVRRDWPGLADMSASRSSVSSYPSIIFSCSSEEKAAASETIRHLLDPDDPLRMLSNWALETTSALEEPPSKGLRLLPSWDGFKQELPACQAEEFAKILDASNPIEEDVETMVSYVDQVALRSTGPDNRYDAAGLYLLAKAMTDRPYLCRSPEPAAAGAIRLLQEFMSKPDYFWALAVDFPLNDPPLWPPSATVT